MTTTTDVLESGMSPLADLVLPGTSRIDIEPLHLSVTQTFSTGTSSNLHLVENADLGVGKVAKDIICASEGGEIVIALDLDNDHDEVHYANGPEADVTETLKRGIEALTLALEAAQRTVRA